MKRWILRGLGVVVVLALLGGTGGFFYVSRDLDYGPPDDRSAWLGQTATVNSGQLAYVQRDVASAQEIWLDVAEDASQLNVDRAEAYRLLSRTAWRVYQNTDQGVTYAEAADTVDASLWENAVAISDAYREAGNYDAAITAAENALNRADDPTARADAADALARAALARVTDKRLDQFDATDLATLAEAQQALTPLFAQPPARLETSALALAVATRLDDGPAMMRAWGSYYHSPTGISAMADQHGSAEILNAYLPTWHGASASLEVRRAVVEALAASHFYDEAELIATDRRSPHVDALLAEPEIETIQHAKAYLSGLRQHTDEYYRRIAVANSSSPLAATLLTLQFKQGRLQLERSLWDALSRHEDLGTYSHDAFLDDMAERFQVYYNEGTTSRVYDLHMGHTVLDATYTADQYGREADLRYVVVGRMISNGYESWLWDGRQQHGGWANDTGIYQVRPAYADGALRRWNQVTDPVQRLEREEEIARLTARDAAIAAETPIAFLPGLAARLQWQAINAVLVDAEARAEPGRVREGFILQTNDAIREFSIFAHEGRHALDKQFAEEWIRDNSAELEFRAKISQVVFNDWPRLAFGAILNPNLGDGTHHGAANQRLMAGAVAWMEEHAAEIEGLDADAPMLPQFDRLSDDQIRAAFRSQDPWADENQTSNIF